MIELIASKTRIVGASEWLCKPNDGYMASDVRRGKISQGFSLLGYFLKPCKRLQVAKKTLKTCANRISQLYEQGGGLSRIGKYVRHFMAWARGGFSAKLVLDIDVYSEPPQKNGH